MGPANEEDDAHMSENRRHQVVVIGSGFGGLFATKALKRADVDVTMIAKTGHHLFQPLLYQVATGILSQGEIAPPTREVLASQRRRLRIVEVESSRQGVPEQAVEERGLQAGAPARSNGSSSRSV